MMANWITKAAEMSVSSSVILCTGATLTLAPCEDWFAWLKALVPDWFRIWNLVRFTISSATLASRI